MITRIFRHGYGFAFLGALDVPPERPLVILEAITLVLELTMPPVLYLLVDPPIFCLGGVWPVRGAGTGLGTFLGAGLPVLIGVVEELLELLFELLPESADAPEDEPEDEPEEVVLEVLPL